MKKQSSKSDKTRLLTEVELELMNILWKLGEGSVADVIHQLPKNRELAYTSVSTILRILEQKKILDFRKEGRGHIYIPILKKKDYEVRTVKHVVENVFDGIPVALVRQLLGHIKFKDDDLKELRALLSELNGPTGSE